MLALPRAVVLEFWSAVMVQAVPTSGGFRGATNARTDGNRIVQDLSSRISVKQALHRFFHITGRCTCLVFEGETIPISSSSPDCTWSKETVFALHLFTCYYAHIVIPFRVSSRCE